jgi:N-glycosylase/DNA lyase
MARKGEKALLLAIERAKREVSPIVKNRIHELTHNKDHFSELCFCLMTANYTAEGGLRIQKEGGDFYSLTHAEILALLKRMGHRFPNMRSKFIHEAKQHKKELAKLSQMKDSQERREWLANNVKGLGYKEASHFLRNIGYMDVAIIDRHIINILAEYGLITRPKTITRKKYLEIEKVLERLACKTLTEQGELDFYLWYLKTGKVLK